MRLAYGADPHRMARNGGIRGGEAGSDSLYIGKARPMELKDDTDVRLGPSQPSAAGSRPSNTGPVTLGK